MVSLLLVAGFFYFMMRFGCGAHMVHGGGHGGHPTGASARDPVCGMDVAPDQGYSKTHAGREYRLCSRPCLDKFEASPDRYVTVEGGAR
jgi:YHS domain-containing protein